MIRRVLATATITASLLFTAAIVYGAWRCRSTPRILGGLTRQSAVVALISREWFALVVAHDTAAHDSDEDNISVGHRRVGPVLFAWVRVGSPQEIYYLWQLVIGWFARSWSAGTYVVAWDPGRVDPGMKASIIRAPTWAAIATPALPAVGLMTIRLVRRYHRRRRVAAGLCRKCGYDLRATPGRCPECGAVG